MTSNEKPLFSRGHVLSAAACSVGGRPHTHRLKGLTSGPCGHLFSICHMAFISRAPEAPSSGKGFLLCSGYIHTGRAKANKKLSRSRNKHFLSNPDNEMDDSLFSQNFFVITFLLTFQRKWKWLTYNWRKEIEVINQARKSLEEMCI